MEHLYVAFVMFFCKEGGVKPPTIKPLNHQTIKPYMPHSQIISQKQWFVKPKNPIKK